MELSSFRDRRGAVAARVPRRIEKIWAAYGLLACLLVGFFVVSIIRGVNQYSSLIDGRLVVGFEFTASLLCLGAALRPRVNRGVVLALGFALLAWSTGDLALTVETLGGVRASTPSPADAFYLAFFPLAYVAVVLFMRAEVRLLTKPNWLDGALAGMGAAALCATFAFRSVLHTAGGGVLAVATNLAYPIGDVLLLSLVVGATTLLSSGSRRTWLLLATGFALNVVGDTFNLFSSTIGASHVGTFFNAVAWPTSILLMSLSVWVPRAPADPFAQQRPTGFLLPGLATVAGLTILVLGTWTHPSRVAVMLATATLVLVGIRLMVSMRGLRNLTVERHQMSLTDHLTGLGNRRRLFDILDTYFSGGEASTKKSLLAFLFVDLNHFKEINDSFGHPAGDDVLIQLATRLTDSLRELDVLVRLGGDEFAIILPDADANAAITIAQRVVASLEKPFVLNAVSAHISASVGIALAPGDASDAAGLMWCADVAMYRAKLGGVAIALYDQEIDDSGNRLNLAEELRGAIEAAELVLHYQPQLELKGGGVSTVEALVRWPHPRLGLMPPEAFLPLAEEAGLMSPLTTWVLNTALVQCCEWRSAGRRMAISVNISPSTLLDDDFIEMVSGLLDKHRVAVEDLILEITETCIIADIDKCKAVVQKLRDMGLVVSIDDFGSGFTSLSYLSSLAIKELKLDRALIVGLTTGVRDRELQLVKSTIELGHSLGLRVVAEGIEDKATLDLIADLGCDVAQGYFIARPRPASFFNFQITVNTDSEAAPAIP